MTIISNHAKERLAQRRGVKHIERHINKIQKWGLPDNGSTLHKGYRYITRDGVLVTVLVDPKELRKEIAHAKSKREL